MDDVTERGDLEARLLYSVIVAGKTAVFANNKIRELLPVADARARPFAWLAEIDRTTGALEAYLRAVRVGRYSTLLRAIRWMLAHSDLDLSTVSPGVLQECPGIGPKTSRFFVMWTRPDESFAVLDVHILRWLREQGYETPTSTPSSHALYEELERAFLTEAQIRDMTPRELDLVIWEAGATAANIVEGT